MPLVRIFVILGATLTTAAAVAFTGIIGFVGLIIPHIMRNLWGSDYRRLIPLFDYRRRIHFCWWLIFLPVF